VIGSGNRLHAENGDADDPPRDWDGVDVDGIVIFNRCGDLFQIGGTSAAVEMRDQDFGKSRLRSIPTRAAPRPTLRIVDRESYRFQIALVIEAGFLNEPFVFRIVSHREEGFPIVVGFADPAEIRVQEAVCAGKQAGRFRRSGLAQLDREYNRCGHDDDR
jgi:hypothetical protein